MKKGIGVGLICLLAAVALAQAPPPAGAQRGQGAQRGEGAAGGQRGGIDWNTFKNPLEPLDSVWIEELSIVEVRDALKAGKTTAIVLTGGVESNGLYLATGKHNYVLQVMGESIARRLGNALVAPIVRLEPGDPERSTFGHPFLSEQTYEAVLTDMITSLKASGFKDVCIMGDSGGNGRGMKAVSDALNAKWNGQGARVHYIPEYYNYGDVKTYQETVLGIKEGADQGYHDDYYISSIIAVADPRMIHAPQRIKANLFSINGASLGPLPKLIENGKKIIAFRTDATVKAIQKSMGTKSN